MCFREIKVDKRCTQGDEAKEIVGLYRDLGFELSELMGSLVDMKGSRCGLVRVLPYETLASCSV